MNENNIISRVLAWSPVPVEEGPNRRCSLCERRLEDEPVRLCAACSEEISNLKHLYLLWQGGPAAVAA